MVCIDTVIYISKKNKICLNETDKSANNATLTGHAINPTFVGFEETFSYWIVDFFSVFIGHHTGSKLTGTDRNGPNCQIGPDCVGNA